MFKYPLVNHQFIYKVKPEPVPGADGSVEKPPSPKDQLAALRTDTDSLAYSHDRKIIRLLMAGAEYKQGDWRTLNKKFAEEFAKEGVPEEAAVRHLKRFQKEAFESLGLTKDQFAVADGKLGPYTLYAFALYFNMRRPKVRVPNGCPQLAKLIESDATKALEAYKKFDFARKVNAREFNKAYTAIKQNMDHFAADSEVDKFGRWAIALWESGYGGDQAEKIGFPEIYGIDAQKYPYATEMALRIHAEGMHPLFVSKEGQIFEYDGEQKKLVPRTAPLLFVNPFEEEKVPAPKPAPGSAPKPKEIEVKRIEIVRYVTSKKIDKDGLAITYKELSDGTWMDHDGNDVKLADILPDIAEGYGDGLYQVTDTGGRTAFYKANGEQVNKA